MLFALAVPGAEQTSANSKNSPQFHALKDTTPEPLPEALPLEEWKRVEKTVDRALAWLVSQQQPDGSFIATDTDQPPMTRLCTHAFHSRGHQPGRGPSGALMTKTMDSFLQCHQPDGMVGRLVPVNQSVDSITERIR